MRRVMVLLFALSVSAVAAACSSDESSESTVTVVLTTPTTVEETSTTPEETSTTSAVSATTSPTTTLAASVRTTLPPVTAPPTSPKPTVPPTTTTIAAPMLVSFNVTNPTACNAPEDLPIVIVTWSFSRVESVYVAVDNENGPYLTNLPPTGELQVPYACPGPHTYFAVATGAGQRLVGQKVVNPTPPASTTTTVVSSSAP